MNNSMKRNGVTILKYSIGITILVLVAFAYKAILNQLVGKSSPHLVDGLEGQQLEMAKAQNLADYIADALHVEYQVERNAYEGGVDSGFLVKLSLKNAGDQSIPGYGWKIYFCHMRMIEPTQIKTTGKALLGEQISVNALREHQEHEKSDTEEPVLIVRHVKGCLFSFEPAKKFSSLGVGMMKIVRFVATDVSAARTDVMPNWYVVVPGTAPKVLQCTAGESLLFVRDFDKPEKWKRTEQDVFNPYTPQQRYYTNFVKDRGSAEKTVIPTPFKMNIQKKMVTITQKWIIVAKNIHQNEVNHLRDKMPLEWKSGALSDQRYIKLILGPIQDRDVGKAGFSQDCLQQAYKLEVPADGSAITITGSTAAGIYYGVQTLCSLVETEQTADGQQTWNVPIGTVVDVPRFAYRGVMLDVARNFHDKDRVLQLLKVMGMYKMNKLQFHLTDDEGWRLEIPGLPDLTEVGGRRGHDLEEQGTLLPFLGALPQPAELGSGFYTISFYRDILAYAKSHHIEVIPEIDMPGHSHAAIKSMQAWRERNIFPGSKREDLGLCDPKDQSKYLSVQMFDDNVVDPCLESTYRFVEHIIKELVDIHKDVNPLKIFHLGGDEVPRNASRHSPSCRKYIEEHGEEVDLKQLFVRRVATIAHKYGLSIAGWEDGYYDKKGEILKRNTLPNKDVYVNAWLSVWEWGKAHRAHELANSDYKVIMSQATYLYLDHPYEPDPEERGLYWSTRYIDTRKVFGFLPYRLFDNINKDMWGNPMQKEDFCDSAMVGRDTCLQLHQKNNIIGLQGQLWTETVRTKEHLEHMVFPRMLALAERAWHKAPWEDVGQYREREQLLRQDWEEFANQLGYKELRRLDQMGIRYRLPVPGAIYENNEIKVAAEFPGLRLQYSNDQGDSWHDIPNKFVPDSCVQLAVSSHDGKRRGRTISVAADKAASRLLTC